MSSKRLAAAAVLALAFASLPATADKEEEPERVTVQHILIGFKRSIPNRKLDRSKAEAKRLAAELLQRATDGEDFDALVEEYTDDRPPGIYLLTNNGVPPVRGGRSRSEMVPRFGDVAFSLEVGEVGLAAYHAALSPYGWHVIKRLE